MRSKSLFWITCAGIAAALAGPGSVHAQSLAPAALSGQVSSPEEGAMEGVLVSARKDGSNMTVTVVTDGKGRYSFPADRIEPGHYTIAIRATGFSLDSPKAVDVTGSGSKADIKLAKADDLEAQLSNAEWLISAPGQDSVKANLTNCVGCHTLRRVFTSVHNADEFKQVFQRMGTYSPGTMPVHPQRLLPGPRGQRAPIPQSRVDTVADWLASVDTRLGDKLAYPIRALPRPTGESTKVIITEYDLPRKQAQPHDVVVGPDGMVWYSDFANPFVGFMDPKTGKVTDIPIPVLKPEEPKGSLDLEVDPHGDLWLAMMYQAGIAKIDGKTHQVTTYPFPKEWQSPSSQASMVSPQHDDVDGKVWTNNQEMHDVYRLDLKTGKYENLGDVKDASGKQVRGYGMPTDRQNDVYLLDFGDARIAKMDAKTRHTAIYSTPTAGSRPRRGRVDGQDRLWFAEYGANHIGMFDPNTKKIREWQMPTPRSDPYDVSVPTRNGEVWTGSMLTDRVSRLDLETEKITDYLLPRSTNIRRVFVEDDGPRPVLWVGSNHGASIVKVEPLD
ncbi:MAG TPA: carboxypeptidase regulatory-like domain-containing protein [Xanthobacteraceae bacterium]|jgi:streptogramin lyase